MEATQPLENDGKAQPTKPKSLFIYGTLSAKKFLAWALTGEATNVHRIEPLTRPARVQGFARYRLENRDYPAAVVCEKSSIDGILIDFETMSQRRKLDDFEGEAYKAVTTKAYVVGEDGLAQEEGEECDIYVWDSEGELLTREPWSLEEFVKERLEDWLDLFEGMELTGGE